MSVLFTDAYLTQLTERLQQNAAFRQESKLASFTVAFSDDRGKTCWIKFDMGKAVEFGVSNGNPDFILSGREEAWEALLADLPLNRLVRRGEIRIAGNVRHCMKNWKMIWMIGQQMKEIGGEKHAVL